jgi:voltage-gated potassium channel
VSDRAPEPAVTPPRGSDPAAQILPRKGPVEKRLSKFLREPPSVTNALAVTVTATTLVVIAGGIAMRIFDHRDFSNIWLGMWWSVQTVTTVGYGDVTPTDVAGRIVAALVMLEGIAFVAITTAAITSTFVARAQRERRAAEGARPPAADGEDARLDDLAARLERIEALLRERGQP